MTALLQTPGKMRGMESPIKVKLKEFNRIFAEENIDVSICSDLFSVVFQLTYLQPKQSSSPHQEGGVVTFASNLEGNPLRHLQERSVNNLTSPIRPALKAAPAIAEVQTPAIPKSANSSFMAISRSVKKTDSQLNQQEQGLGHGVTAFVAEPSEKAVQEDEHEVEIADNHKSDSEDELEEEILEIPSGQSTPLQQKNRPSESSAVPSPIGFAGLPTRAPLPKKSSARSTLAATSHSIEETPKHVSTEVSQSENRPSLNEQDDQKQRLPTTSAPDMHREEKAAFASPQKQALHSEPQAPASMEATQGSFMDVLRKARRLLFDTPETPQKPSTSRAPNVSPKRPTVSPVRQLSRSVSPQKPIPANSVVARLMAPTQSTAAKQNEPLSPSKSNLRTEGISLRQSSVKSDERAQEIPKIVFGKTKTPSSIKQEEKLTDKPNTVTRTLLKPLESSPTKPLLAKPAVPARVSTSVLNSKLTSQSLQPKRPRQGNELPSVAPTRPGNTTEVASQKTAEAVAGSSLTAGPRTRAAAAAAAAAKSTSTSSPRKIVTSNSNMPSKPLVRTSLSVKSSNKMQQAKQDIEAKIRTATAAAVKANSRPTPANSTHTNASNSTVRDGRSAASMRAIQKVPSKPDLSSARTANPTKKPIRHLPGYESQSSLRTGKRPSETEFETPLQHKHKLARTNQTKPPSLIKAAVMGNARLGNAPVVEGVKFSSESINFAPSGSNANNTRVTPIKQSGTALKLKLNLASLREDPQNKLQSSDTPNGNDIILPEIMSESEDDDDGSVLADWANSPELRELLIKQQKMNPDQIFGPMPHLRMDEVFEKSTKLSKLRPRSSSANWSGADRLTQQEIESYAKEMGYNR